MSRTTIARVPTVIVLLSVSLVRSQVATWNNGNQLHPVQGLYVKPSSDGTTGDLYVAATEENGSKTQWLTDQPVNLLSSASQQATVPMPMVAFPASHEESQTTKKRAVISPPVQYAYAMPVASSDGLLPYPYAVPTSASSSETTTPSCDPKTAFPYSPFQYFYPHMMSAYANAKSILKDTGMNDDKAASVLSPAAPFWPSSSYGYPMYVMVDPSAWTQTLTTPAPTKKSSKEDSK